MRTKLLLRLLFVVVPTGTFAQTGTIKGRIQSVTGQPLAGISVGLEPTTMGATTNETGNFTINNIPVGTYTLTATSIGHVAKKQNVSLLPNKTLTLNLQLSESNTELTEVVVKGRSESYIERNSEMALRSSAPLKDIPQSIQVITRQVLIEQQAYTLNEALNNMAGVTPKGDWNYVNMRGFLTGAGNMLINGQRNGFINEDQSPTLPYVEKVEVLRGPSSVLFGNGAIGGTINMVTKKPQKEFRVGANLTVGSFGLARLQADVTGALSRARTLTGLLSIGAETGGNFTRDFTNQNIVITPMFAWAVSPRTSLYSMTIFRSADQTSNYSPGVPVVNGDVFAAPWDFTYASSNGRATSRSIQQQLNLNHAFTDRWQANVWLNYSSKNDRVGIYARGANSPTLDSIGRSFQSWNGPITGTAINAYLNGLLNTGPIEHRLVIGYDYGRNLQDYPTGFQFYFTEPLNGQTLERPNFDPSGQTPDFYQSFREKISRQTNAVYVQDNIRLGEKLKALISLRYDRIVNNSLGEYTKGETSYDTSATSAFVPRLGIVYQPSQTVTLYGSYAEGFEPQYSNSRATGGPFAPERGKQWEIGLRKELLGGRLNTSVAIYQIRKINVVNADPADATGTRQIATGEVTSQGVEVSLTGQLTNQWNLLANYAHNRIYTSKSTNAAEVGVNFGDTPRNMVNLWTTYTLAQHLKLGVGYRYNSERTTRGLTLPAYSVLDGLVSYSRQKINVAVNVGNLFNTRYVLGTFNPAYTFQGAPRNVRVSLGYNF